MLETVRSTIAAHVAATGWRNVSFLRELLCIPKPRMQEHEAVRFVAEALRRVGCDVDVFPGEGLGEPTPVGPPLNILARRPGGGGGQSILLEAHLDTVPIGALDRWTHDPWGGDIADGNIYARGAHDDVAGVALLCLVASALTELGLVTRGDVHLLVTTEEEYSSGGMRAFLKRHPGFKPDAHLLVDGNEEPDLCIVAHPGSLSFTISIPGPFGTAQEPQYRHSANPIEFAASLMSELRRLEELPIDPGWPTPTVSFAAIESAGWISNVPERCDLRVWGNVIPPTTIEQYKRRVESCVREQAQTEPWFAKNPPRISWGPIEVPAMITPTDSPFLRAVSDAHLRSCGRPLKPRRIGGWGDMRLLGGPNALFYGPGGGANYHAYDEHYHLADLDPMLRALLFLIADWCETMEDTSR